MALKPASMKASSKADDVAWSTFQPNTLPPSISGAMRSPIGRGGEGPLAGFTA